MTVNEGHEVTVTILGHFLYKTTYVTVNTVKNIRILDVRDLWNWLLGHLAFEADRALVSLILVIILINLHLLNHSLLEQFLHYRLGYMSKMLMLYGQRTCGLFLRWLIHLLFNTVIY